MDIQSDVFFKQGSTHDICQDYARAGDAQVALSDGCSSAPHTDFGSRLLVNQFFESRTNEIWNDSDFSSQFLASMVLSQVETLHLPPACLHATLMTLKFERGVHGIIGGDGVVAIKYCDGQIAVLEKIYLTGAPYYPIYDASPEWKKEYMKKFRTKEPIYKNYMISPEGEIKEVEERSFPFNFEVAPENGFYINHLNGVEAVAVFSDGIDSFYSQKNTETSRYGEKIPVSEMIRKFMDFKQGKGEFVKRRCKRVLKDDSIYHYDDFSMGALYFPEVRDENPNTRQKYFTTK